MTRLDAPPVQTETEAAVLMRHHLRLAAMYFEATPETFPEFYFDGEFSTPAMKAWVEQMEALYPDD